ncbi:complement C1q-like protein 3 [Ruditapes philippinarum]|uniref:complement C1q-like protein 3 n=1 Tax=Ruditapes philippinarum TaxID=129788 RepID=UPI00295C1F54|nr:complement C1q-like protein 3 [Ruditapes philippinarum]
MIYCISFVCFISLTAFGEKLQEQQNLQSIWKELEKLKEIDFLKERTLALENEVKGLKLQNYNLNQKVETLERRCAVHSVEDVERTEKTGTMANTTNNHSFSFNKTFESRKRTSKLNRQRSILPRQVSIQTHIAFTAGVSVLNLHNLGINQAIIFDHVITNIGNAYHPHTGTFIVPVKGAYAITLTMTVEPNKLQWLELIVDGGSTYYISAGQADARNYASTTKQWILELHTGSEVWVRKKGAAHTDLNGFMNTIISGYLLFQT